MEKKIFTATLLTVAITAFLTIYWLLEPHRVRVQTERMKTEAAERGKPLYLTHCSRCHGEQGGGRRGIRPIHSKNYLEKVDDTLLYKIIERGIPRTGMVALGDKEGGPLNKKQIDELVAFIRSWQKTAASVPEEPPPKERPLFVQEEAAYVGSKSCIECHEGLNKDHIAIWKASPMAARAFSLIQKEKDKTKCIPCHATGYDPDEKTYQEENVGCEACHGPGGKYQEMMSGPEALDGGKIARENALRACTRCHKAHIGKKEHILLARRGGIPYP